jgi:hypothetical protein
MLDLRRRHFITLLSGAAAAWPLRVRAQRPAKIARVGIIDDAPIWDHFRQGLREAGYVEGQNLAIEYRSAGGQPDRLAAVAQELVGIPVGGRDAARFIFGRPSCNRLRRASHFFASISIPSSLSLHLG